MKSYSATILAALAAKAAAHGLVTKITIGTATYQGYDPNFQYMPTPPAVIGWSSPESQDRGPVPGNALGDPDNYLAPVSGDFSAIDKTALKFFKIDGVGMTSTTGTPPKFADDDMIANNNTWTVKIPSDIAPGNYVLRHETIALHQAGSVGGSQPYPQCINLQITGSGTATPDGVLGTALYTETDPGIQFDIYKQFTSTDQYPVPGPPLYSGASAGGVGTGSGGTSAPAPSPSASVTSPGKVVAPSATAAPAPATSGKTGCKVKRWHARDFA